MIEELQFYINQSEDNPKVKDIFLKVAKLPEDKQKAALDVIKLVVECEKYRMNNLPHIEEQD